MVYFITWERHGFSHKIFHSIRKLSKTLRMGKAWEIGSHSLSIKWVAFFIRFPFCGILHHMGNAWFSHQFLIACEKAGKPIKWEKPETWFPRKSYKTVSYVQKLGNWCSYSSHGIGALFSLDSHALAYCIC